MTDKEKDRNVDGKMLDAYYRVLSSPPGWMYQASCADPSLDLNDVISNPEKTAQTLCSKCPVIDECVAWAVDKNASRIVFGGKIPDEKEKGQ